MNLDILQNRAATTAANNVIVIAGAGSGKTRTLTERINFWLDNGVPSEQIAAITFTNIAAQEMQSRIKPGFKGYIGTIHSLSCLVLEENNIKHDTWLAKKDKFNKLLQVGMGYVKKRYNYVLVDEFQDVGNQEYDFIRAIQADNYFFVADDWQAIYQFKGGNLNIFRTLMQDTDEWELHYLLYNYRSNYKICKTGYDIISNVRSKEDKYMTVKNDNEGGVFTGQFYHALQKLEKDKQYGDWMILARFNDDVDDVLEILKSKGIPAIGFKKSDLTFEKITEIMNSNTVKVLTIHSAKGLEAKNVILYKAGRWYNDDEFRILYVAATRAKENLYWCDKIPPVTGTYSTRYLNTREDFEFYQPVELTFDEQYDII